MTTTTIKLELATKIYNFIVEHATPGKTVTLWTMTKGTAIKRKHLPMVRLNGNSVEVQSGKRWLDYTYATRVTAE